MKRDEYGDPVGGSKSLRNRKQKMLHQILLMNNTPQQPSEGSAYGMFRGSGKPSGQMAAFGKQEKKPNPYGEEVKDDH